MHALLVGAKVCWAVNLMRTLHECRQCGELERSMKDERA